MFKVYKYEGKTKEEALNKGLIELNLLEENIVFKEIEKEKKIFQAKKIEVEIIKKTDIIKEIKDFLKELSEKMNFEFQSEIKENSNVYSVIVVSENNSVLIGKNGKTINAIELFLKNHLKKITGFNLKIFLDISNYRAKKISNIEIEIKKLAKEVLDTKVAVQLDSMNSYERRIVHTIIGEYTQLETESLGVEPTRYIVIKYKED